MQVADLTNKASSAALGAQQTRSVSMVEDAGFLMMLSSNLYSNQLLAAIREPLCNAWDAHIEAGKTDTPIKITITEENELILKDFGLGIPDDKIEQVYGTYGGSTKRNDSKTTGGFGLGSKAPWAIVDAFRVTSCHNGSKAVYNMAHSVVENDGKPGITPILTNLPTTETGLTVAFTIDESEVQEVTTYIATLAGHGNMNVDFDVKGDKVHIPQLKMSHEPGSYNVDHYDWYQSYMGQHNIFVRYGSVLYPVLKTTNTEKAVDLLENFMSILRVDRIVVQAAPNTLALTPSREALSSQKMTEDGITQLCLDLVNKMESDIVSRIPSVMHDTIQKLQEGKIFRDHYDFSFGQKHSGFAFIANGPVERYINSSLGRSFKAKYTKALSEAVVAGNKTLFKHSDKLSRVVQSQHISFMHSMRRIRSTNTSAIGFCKRYWLVPLLKALDKAGVDKHNLYYVKKHYRSVYLDNVSKALERRHSSLGNQFFDQFFVGKPKIFITSRIKNCEESIYAAPAFNNNHMAWAIRIKPNTKDVDKKPLLDILNRYGYEVIDLTLNHDWDPVAKEKLEKAAYKAKVRASQVKEDKPKVTNFLRPISCIIEDGKRFSYSSASLDTAEDITDKVSGGYYFEPSDVKFDRTALGNYFKLDWATEEDIAKGVVVRNGIERRMAVARGAVSANEYFFDRLIALAKIPDVLKYFTHFRQRSLSTHFCVSSQTIKLCKLFNIKLPNYDKMYHNELYEDIKTLIESNQTSVELRLESKGEDTAWVEKLCDSSLIELPFIKKLKTIEKDRMIRDLTRNYSVFQWMSEYPERSSALKSLVLSALKTGKHKP